MPEHRRRALRVLLPLAALAGVAALAAAGLALLGIAAAVGRPPWHGPGPPRFVFGPLVLVAVVAGVALTRSLRRVISPLGDLAEAADRVADGDLNVSVRPRGPGEVRRFATTFDRMVGRLRDAEAQRRRLLADVSHELRTPLTVVQGTLEAMLDGVRPRDDEHLAPLLAQMQLLGHLIEDLRTLSLAEAGALRLHREPTDLGALAEDAVAAHRAAAASAGAELRVDTDDVPALDADPLRLAEVLGNLLANAVRHSPGGHVRVRVTRRGGAAVLEVSDDGEGIVAADLPHVFDRFHRSSGSTGSGLGLAVARGIVEAHGGTIAITSVGVGEGTTVTVALPLP